MSRAGIFVLDLSVEKKKFLHEVAPHSVFYEHEI